MNKSIIALLISIFLLSPIAQADSSSQRRDRILSTINAELRELSRLNKKTKRKRPNLLLRMADLLLEKARHTKEKENLVYLGASDKERSRRKKSDYFKKSRKYYLQSKKIGNYLLKKFKKFDGLGTVYFILAHSAKEFQEEKKAKTFFSRAIRLSKRSEPIHARAKLALAEIYYNEKNYKKAAPLYQSALRGKKDQWWTKDAFNLSWSYFRTGRQNQAIKLMREVYKLSKNPKYIDKSSDVERDLAYFYAASGRIREAVLFYKNIDQNISENLLKVSKFLIDQGKYASAEKALTAVGKNQKTEAQSIEMNLALIDLYERFGRQSKHLATARELLAYQKQGKLSSDEVENLRYHLQRMSALLQKQVVSKRYQNQKKTRRRKANYAVEYFTMLAEMDSSVAQKSYFHAAETYYADSNFDKALELYDKSLNATPSRKEGKKLEKLANDGMMVSLGARGVRQSSVDKYLIPTYRKFLALNPSSAQANKVYQRLFSSFYDRGDINESEKLFWDFKKRFPKDIKTQEAMISKIVDYYRKKNDKVAVTKWVEKINSGELNVSPKYRAQAAKLLLKMQFAKVEEANSKGDKKAALLGYLNIYEDPSTGRAAKKNAAYNLSTLFYELGRPDETYRWADRALTLMSSKDIKQFETSYLSIASDLFNRRRLDKSVDIYRRTLKSVCKKRSKNKKVFFKNTIVILLAQGKISEAKKAFKDYSKCGIPYRVMNEVRFDYLSALSDSKKWTDLKAEINYLSRDKNNKPRLIEYIGKLYQHYIQSGRLGDSVLMRKKALSYYAFSKKARRDIPLKGLDFIAERKLERLNEEAKKLARVKLFFPEKKYNAALKNKFQYLDRVTTLALEVLDVGSGEGIVKAYKELVQSYENLAGDIKSFTPPGKGKDYINSFKKSMANLVRPIEIKARDFKKEALRQIGSNKILSSENKWFLSKSLDSSIFYQYPHNGVLMDRGGRP